MYAYLIRYLEVVRAIQHREPAHEVVKHLMLTTPEKALFAQQLITVARYATRLSSLCCQCLYSEHLVH